MRYASGLGAWFSDAELLYTSPEIHMEFGVDIEKMIITK